MSVKASLDVSEQSLAESRWSLAEKGKAPWSTTLYFAPDGKIAGYRSPNEVTWRLDDNVLRIFNGNHREMWRFEDFHVAVGGIAATSHFPDDVSRVCMLTEIEKRIQTDPSEELLVGSRWSLGEDGQTPWSTSLYFRPGGRIGGYKSPNEAYWTVEESVLRIFNATGAEMWRFEVFSEIDGKRSSVGTFRKEKDTKSFCSLKEMERLPAVAVSEEDFIGSRWSVGEEGKTPWSTTLRFGAGGCIEGYASPNEVYWSLEGPVLRIFTEEMKVMWRFDRFTLVDGALQAYGEFPREREADIFCLLTEIRSETLPAEEHLLTSRWSLGEDGKAPWSTSFYFRPHGKIGGYKSPNEVYWNLKTSALEIYNETRETMWRFERFDTADDKLRSVGRFRKEKNIETFCVLTEMPHDDVPSAETLIASRWSLGQEGKAPWSTSFYFRPDGRIGGYKSQNEGYWSLKGSVLRIFDANKLEMWRFESFAAVNGTSRAIGSFQREPNIDSFCVLTQLPALTASTTKPVRAVEDVAASPTALPPADNKIKLLIWDLDDTFWSGTLAEGGIADRYPIVQLVKTMAGRGILNSICSKNDFKQAKAELVRLGVWDYFIFPKIRFAPKGMMIREIIELCQLRAPSVLFIEDNMINVNEALHYNPGLQICGPEAIESLLEDKRCRGKPDRKLVRLARYKILEQKASDRTSENSENLDFLRQSEICISFHEDVEAELPRIHDLINRTNQLNFTKNRWPEDEAAALAAFRREIGADFDSQFGYVKVSDRYGKYGICGFFLIRNGDCHHFTFSCRALNMGIEQFVWQKLGRPHVEIRGEVVSSLGDAPDWISVVEDADFSRERMQAPKNVSICVRGACDLAMMTHYLRMYFDTNRGVHLPLSRLGHPFLRQGGGAARRSGFPDQQKSTGEAARAAGQAL